MHWLARRLRQQGYQTIRFRYPTVRGKLQEQMGRLRELITEQKQPVHILAHSLGGVLSLHTLTEQPVDNVARIVCMGSPLVDTHAGRNLARIPLLRRLLGKILPEAIFDKPLKQWSGQQQVGVVAGSIGVDIGQLVARLKKPSDGVVEYAETQLPGIADTVLLPVTHIGMLFSRRVIDEVQCFLENGRFEHGAIAGGQDHP